MHWILWLCLSNIMIMLLEYLYRAGHYSSFLNALPYIIIPVLISQCGLFYGFRGASSIFIAGATFTLINVLLRVVNSYILHEPPNNYNWLGLVLLIVSIFLLKVK